MVRWLRVWGHTMVRAPRAAESMRFVMAGQESIFEGKTLDDAVRMGLNALGLSRAEVMITVMEEGSGGFLGLGARPYKVRVMPRPGGPPREPAERADRGDRSRGGRGGRRDREGSRGPAPRQGAAQGGGRRAPPRAGRGRELERRANCP